MYYISELQEIIVLALREHPGSSYAQMVKITGLPHGGIDDKVKSLIAKGIVSREGRLRHYRLFASDDPYEVTEGGKRPKVPKGTIADPALQEAAAFQLSHDQLVYIRNNKDLPRSELARRLGIGKLELNFAMDQKRK